MSISVKQTLLTSTDGDTVLLRLGTAGTAQFSFDGITWFTISGGGGGGSEYFFGYGLQKLGNTISVDTAVVATWTDLRDESSSDESTSSSSGSDQSSSSTMDADFE